MPRATLRIPLVARRSELVSRRNGDTKMNFSLEPPASASLKPPFVRPEARFEQKHWCRDRFI